MTLSPYGSLDVLYGGNKVDGSRWFVRDQEESHLFNLVEYLGKPGRLTCYCPDGVAHAESAFTEAPCPHLRAVVDQRMAELRSSRPQAPINVSAWVD